MQKNCIIIPCYNEENRLDTSSIIRFLESHGDVYDLVFVNDGSSDRTQEILNELQSEHPQTITLLLNEKNCGKAESIRKGMLYAYQNKNYSYVGFLDADLATPIEEIIKLTQVAQSQTQFTMIIGSRIKRLGADIQRKTYRHFIGRIFSTFASLILQLPVYDTQCGIKLFKSTIIPSLFDKPFLTRWLFDVELIARLKQVDVDTISHVYEYPISKWHDVSGSKIKLKHMLGVPFDLVKIYLKYR